jgi:mono/diheme cytochrome c family protein
MDRHRSRALALTATALLLIAAGDAPLDPPLRAARWLAPGTSIVALASAPASCLIRPRDADAAEAVAIGRAAFHTPLLLGGQAARVGLSCASCHRNGRDNPHFLFPGLSGAPGTADVTTSLLSSHRGDGIANPKPIPDLAAPERRRIISRDPESRALENFIHGAIVEEFDGAEPPPRVLAGLATYVRAISPNGCERSAKDSVSLTAQLTDANEAVKAAASSWRKGDLATARLMLASARSSLGLIDERYAAIAEGRNSIRQADRELAMIQLTLDAGAPDIETRIASWRTAMTARAKLLQRDERRSLFNPAVLKRYDPAPKRFAARKEIARSAHPE